MRCLVIFLIIASCVLSAKGYEVLDGKKDGYTVSAGNFVYITTPNHQMIQVTNLPFVGDGYSLPPVEPILCTWDPTHTWLGIFIVLKQTTEIHFFDLKTNNVLVFDPAFPKYPDWFGRPQIFAHTKPVKWSDNTLLLNTTVKFKDGSTRKLSEAIVIKGDTAKRVIE